MPVRTRALLIFGTRPEAIKLAPVYQEMRREADFFDVRVCVTGQHRHMLDQVLELFDIKADYDLDVMMPNQDLFDITCSVLSGLKKLIRQLRPNLLIVHGDTTTTMAASMAGFYEKIPVAHVEAGLRTGNLQAPWPEEFNRRVSDLVASWHFAPTISAQKSLIKEGIPESQIVVTGNTVVDALLSTIKNLQSHPTLSASVINTFPYLNDHRKMILLTGHRRESFGSGFENIFNAINDIVRENPNVDVVYPVHLNPSVKNPAEKLLANYIRDKRIFLIEPQDYLAFVYLMSKSDLIITDSGGIQEEAPTFGVPILVTRDVTERPEAIESGAAVLVGTNRAKIVNEARRLLQHPEIDRIQTANPYGDGSAAKKIVSHLKNCLAQSGSIEQKNN